MCYEPCTDSTTCELGYWCDKAAGSPTANHCDQNLCGPQLAQYGYQAAAMMGSCDATVSGAGDGICMGPLADYGASSAGELGLCFAVGSLAAGAACPADAANGDAANLCNSGMCLIDTQGATTGTCRAFCTLLDGTDCAADSVGPTTCLPLGGMAGVCTPQSASPTAAGAACTPSQTEEACVEDAVCLDPNGGANNTCASFCDTRVGTCASGGTCTPTSQSQTDMLGICI
jgi:hypothetical protein